MCFSGPRVNWMLLSSVPSTSLSALRNAQRCRGSKPKTLRLCDKEVMLAGRQGQRPAKVSPSSPDPAFLTHRTPKSHSRVTREPLGTLPAPAPLCAARSLPRGDPRPTSQRRVWRRVFFEWLLETDTHLGINRGSQQNMQHVRAITHTQIYMYTYIYMYTCIDLSTCYTVGLLL